MIVTKILFIQPTEDMENAQSTAYIFSFFYLLNTPLMERMNKAMLWGNLLFL